VERRVKKRAEFILHLVIYVAVNLILWAICLIFFGDSALMLIPLLTTLGWGVGLLWHGVDTYLQTGALDAMREREMRREMEWVRAHRGPSSSEEDAYEKPKRERAVRLSADGELIPADSDEDDSQLKRSGRGRN
jgi:hypothetical protein